MVVLLTPASCPTTLREAGVGDHSSGPNPKGSMGLSRTVPVGQALRYQGVPIRLNQLALPMVIQAKVCVETHRPQCRTGMLALRAQVGNPN